MANQANSSKIFHRPELARKLAQQILHVSPTSASSSGVFLAAPRRTGKTTFMRQDLTPALVASGALVIYVDLWEDPKADPSDVIVTSIRAALAQNEPALVRLAKGWGLGGAKVGGVEFSLDRVGLGKDVSLVQALSALSETSKTIIVLIIDEAQHAITTSAGNDAMFALKSARDELNSNQHGLRVVCTGSNRDKLAMLKNSKDQAFFGAPLINFPPLGAAYVKWFCDHADDLPARLDPDMVLPLFERSGHRPEILGAAADELRFDFALEDDGVNERFLAAVESQIAAANDDTMRVVHSLTPIQFAVLCVLAAAGERYAPFEAATLEKYRIAANRVSGAETAIEFPAVQGALVALQEKSLVWKASRGVYAIEDIGLVDLLRNGGYLDGL